MSQVVAPSRRRESSGSTSIAGGNDDHGAVEPPPGAKAKPPVHTGPAPAGRPGGSVAIRSRVTAAQSAIRSANRPGPREIASCAEPSPASAKPSRSGCSQANQRSAASREAKTVATGSSTSASTVTLTSVAPAARTSDRLPEALEDARGIHHRTGAQCSGRDLVIATSPVRAISISPWGRTMRSKESILSWVPVTSIVSERRETSTILPS